MNIKLKNGHYKSISSFEWDDIPNFSVITGINGSGKTQLLEMIYYHYDRSHYRSYEERTKIKFPELSIENVDYKKDDLFYLKNNQIRLSDQAATSMSALQSHIHQLYEWSIKKNSTAEEFQKIITNFEKRTGKKVAELSEEEFITNLPIDYIIVPGLISNEKIQQFFYSYHYRYLNELLKKKSDDQIKLEIGNPPWEVLNKDLNRIGFQYELTHPEGTDLFFPYHLRLKHKGKNTLLNFNDLSGGEQVIISLVFWSYNSIVHNVFPKFILLDEPDAHLHPTMTRIFVDVISDILVDKYGARVIMTTHSPSTVALIDDINLFEMDIDEPRIRSSTNKAHLISILTSNLITVTKRTKYVIVEDDDDVNFYTTLLMVLKNEGFINEDISIVFISAAYGSGKSKTPGGKTVADSWVSRLRDSGLQEIIVGLVDGEAKKDVGERLLTIERHSIENYLLDPLIIFGVLLDNKILKEEETFGLRYGDDYKLREMSDTDLQNIANFVLNSIESNNGNFSEDMKIRKKVKFCTNHSLDYPQWLIDTQGHRLFEIIRVKWGNNIITYKNLLNSLEKIRIIPEEFNFLFLSIWK